MRTSESLPKLLAALNLHPAPIGISQKQLCAFLNTHQAGVSRNLQHLKDLGEVYICRWERGRLRGSFPCAFYALGNHADVKCDVIPLTPAERTRRSRAKARAPKPQHDMLTRAFFGMSAHA